MLFVCLLFFFFFGVRGGRLAYLGLVFTACPCIKDFAYVLLFDLVLHVLHVLRVEIKLVKTCIKLLCWY